MTMQIESYVRGGNRTFIINGEHYEINHVHPPADFPRNQFWDSWRYTLPTGETYSHPTQFGALLMILKHLGGGRWANLDN